MFVSAFVFAQDNQGQLAYQYYTQGEYSKAIKLYKELNKKVVSAAYFSPYLNCLIHIGDYKEAERLSAKMVKKFPKSLNYQVVFH